MNDELELYTPKIAQHNNLIRSYMHLGGLEARIFTLLLKGVKKDDTELKKVEIKVSDIIGDNPSGKAYQLLKDACDELMSKRLDLLQVGISKKAANKNDYHKVGIVQELQLDSGSGFVRGLFTDRVQSYLIQLKKDYALADIEHLMSLKSGYSHRIYWLMKSYQSLGEVKISVEEFKKMVCGDKDELGNQIDKYPRYYDFKKYVILPAFEDIREMLNVHWVENKKGKKTESLTFKFPQEGKISKITKPVQGSLFDKSNAKPKYKKSEAPKQNLRATSKLKLVELMEIHKENYEASIEARLNDGWYWNDDQTILYKD
ncbi:replication initiation protein [Pontibacter silvestris]|nr:replication initiation protein [Pontibacter silvestris]MCC9138802.1 replication initiation protein [Pontibacter silvestris]